MSSTPASHDSHFKVRPIPTTLEIEAKLRSAGVNPTAQRLAICRYVLGEGDHPTADDVKTWADQNFPKLSLATVYNSLNTLVAAGLLRELKLPHSDKVFYDSRVSDHHHFLDQNTGKLFDLMPEQVQVTPRLERGFAIESIEVLIRGRRA
jgi:Fur family transcriptional regulator, iron response regulator